MYFISIDRKRISYNRMMHKDHWLPPIVIEQEVNGSMVEQHCWELDILGPSKVVYRPDNKEPGDPTPNAWIETSSPLEMK